MRRIYKADNVTTSESFFLLADIAEHPLAGVADTVQPDDPAEEATLYQGKPNAFAPDAGDAPPFRAIPRNTVHDTVQELAQLEALRGQIIAQATSEAARLIQEGHTKAQAEYNDALARAAEQIERDRQSACEEGRQRAFTQTLQDITNCVRDIEQTLTRLESMQAVFITGYEQDLKWMALEIAQKVLMDTVADDDTRLLPLVMAAVNSAANAPWMTVEISERMTGLLTQLQQRLKDFPDGRVSLRLVDAPSDTCIVETPDTFFDASITQQIENLKGYFAAEQG